MHFVIEQDTEHPRWQFGAIYQDNTWTNKSAFYWHATNITQTHQEIYTGSLFVFQNSPEVDDEGYSIRPEDESEEGDILVWRDSWFLKLPWLAKKWIVSKSRKGFVKLVHTEKRSVGMWFNSQGMYLIISQIQPNQRQKIYHQISLFLTDKATSDTVKSKKYYIYKDLNEGYSTLCN